MAIVNGVAGVCYILFSVHLNKADHMLPLPGPNCHLGLLPLPHLLRLLPRWPQAPRGRSSSLVPSSRRVPNSESPNLSKCAYESQPSDTHIVAYPA
jgi:hypothetical protein